jgi:hypothetical protein
MTVTDQTQTEQPAPTGFEMVTLDLYRDIHKAIRAELFALTCDAGRIDPGNQLDRIAIAQHVHSTVELLVAHAEHEDEAIEPVLEVELPQLAEQVADDHIRLEARLVDLQAMADEAVDVADPSARGAMHRLYVELASFTGDYLAHQDLEERQIMPALESAVGVERVVAIHGAILANIPPEEMAKSLAVMLPAMNVEDRTELLNGMRESAPPEAFEGVWGLAGSVLAPADHAALAQRLDLS